MNISANIKTLLAGLLISIFVFLLSSSSILNLWYFLGNSSFEQAFCENLDKPEKSCHGSCKMKTINKAPSSSENLASKVILLPETPNFAWTFYKKFFINIRISNFTLSNYFINQSRGIFFLNDHFHPPEV